MCDVEVVRVLPALSDMSCDYLTCGVVSDVMCVNEREKHSSLSPAVRNYDLHYRWRERVL